MDEAQRIRAECLEFLVSMPDEALPELYVTLKDMKEFYETQREYVEAYLPQVRKVQGRLGKSIVRPEFPIEEGD